MNILRKRLAKEVHFTEGRKQFRDFFQYNGTNYCADLSDAYGNDCMIVPVINGEPDFGVEDYHKTVSECSQEKLQECIRDFKENYEKYVKDFDNH